MQIQRVNKLIRFLNLTEKEQTSDERLSQAYSDIENLTMEVRKMTRELSEKNEELSESKMSLENQKVWALCNHVCCIP